jgi:hypothetical protein
MRSVFKRLIIKWNMANRLIHNSWRRESLIILSASLNNFQIGAATPVHPQIPKTFRCRSNKLQLRGMSVTTATKLLLNIRVWDLNLVMNSVIYSFIDPVSRPDQDCTSSGRLNIVRRHRDVFGSSKWEVFRASLLALTILWWLLDFWKICKPRAQTTYSWKVGWFLDN